MAKKSKSMKDADGKRKLATGAGRAKQKSGGEAQKETTPPDHSRRTGSSKQRKS